MHALLYTVPSAAPQNVRGYASGSTAINLQWSPPTYQYCIRHYSIIVREVNTGTQTQHTSTGLQTTINRLHPYYTYECRVAAYTTREGVLSRPINITTDQDGKHELAVSTNVHGVTILTSY